MHHRTDAGRVALFFEATIWSGNIVNREPEKCCGWHFVPLDRFPDNVVPYIAEALSHYTAGVPYAERGWTQEEDGSSGGVVTGPLRTPDVRPGLKEAQL